MKKIVITQSNYIPWKGYFDLFSKADEIVLLDSVQYTPRDWRNRNRIVTPQGDKWLSIPVYNESRNQLIRNTRIVSPMWSDLHWKTLYQNYGNAPYFNEIESWLHPLYARAAKEELLSIVNKMFITETLKFLSLERLILPDTEVSEMPESLEPTERLLEICRKREANVYLTGPAAKNYLDVDRFNSAGIAIKWMEYGPYPTYHQKRSEFNHFVSIVDLLFSVGKNARNYIFDVSQ